MGNHSSSSNKNKSSRRPNVPDIKDNSVPMSIDKTPPRSQVRRKVPEPVSGALSDVFQVYKLEKKELGHGHYGIVRKGIHRENGNRVAIKTIPKSKVSRPETLKREIEILKQVNHPNIIKLYQVFEDSRNLHLVTELCTGGELFDRIIDRGHYTEADAAVLVAKLCSAVKHCHDLGICHRDLKPENFLFQTKDADAELKVIDFGLSRVDDGAPGGYMTTRVGTPYYIAPEVLGRNYDKSCDMWSVGVITYILLSGYPPFYGDSDPEIFASVRRGRYSYDTPEWQGVSKEAKEFIDSLLKLDSKKRMTADQTLVHPWLSGSAPSTERAINKDLMSSLKRFTAHNKLKKAALGVIADQLTEIEIKELQAAFKKIDADGDGVITVAELAASVADLGFDLVDNEVRELVAGMDIDGDGKIDYNEFIAATMERNMFNKKNHLLNAFNYFDTKKQGVITLEDLIQFMGSELHAKEVMDQVDTNKDGKISFEEFVFMMKSKGMSESGVSSTGGSPNMFTFGNEH